MVLQILAVHESHDGETKLTNYT